MSLCGRILCAVFWRARRLRKSGVCAESASKEPNVFFIYLFKTGLSKFSTHDDEKKIIFIQIDFLMSKFRTQFKIIDCNTSNMSPPLLENKHWLWVGRREYSFSSNGGKEVKLMTSLPWRGATMGVARHHH